MKLLKYLIIACVIFTSFSLKEVDRIYCSDENDCHKRFVGYFQPFKEEFLPYMMFKVQQT